MSWNFLAERLTGLGVGELLTHDLPLSDVSTTDVLSGPPRLTATISPRHRAVTVDGADPMLREGATAIYAEDSSSEIRGGWLLQPLNTDEESLTVDGFGFCSYPAGQPYDGEQAFVAADPLDIVRHIWAHLQAQTAGNLGMRLGATVTPVRVGRPEDPNIDVGVLDRDAGPFRLAEWETDDLGDVIDDLARSTPFEYHERHQWNPYKTAVEHYLDFGYPRIGRRRTDLRFVLGENLLLPPKATMGRAEGAANAVRVLGAGEGRDKIRSPIIAERDGRLRRVDTIDDPSIRTRAAAARRARQELAKRMARLDVSSVVVTGPLPDVGDEIRLRAKTDWSDVDQWFRVISITTSPDEGDQAVLNLLPPGAA